MPDAKPTSKKKGKGLIFSILILLSIGYFGFLLYESVYVNFQTNEKISLYTKNFEELQAEQENLKDLIAYYQTSTFQELEARKKLGLKMPGEKVVKVEVPEAKNEKPQEQETALVSSAKSNPQLWWEYLFYQDL